MENRRYTLSKEERLCSKAMIERLFSGSGSRSFPAFPLRVVYMEVDSSVQTADASILISVSKKRFKRAVKRNLVKRQIREAYRRHKHLLLDGLQADEKKMILAFIWLDNEVHPSDMIERKMRKILTYIAESLQK